MATICAAVLNLPIVATATLLRLPICAIHSLKAEMVISLPMIGRKEKKEIAKSFQKKESGMGTCMER